LAKSKTISRTENVYRYIREKIIYGDLPPGELLNEGDLAQQLKVSKTPVREALNGLKHDGLIEVIPYKGYFVRNLSIKEIRELFEIRIIIESKGVELATLRGTDEQIKNLKGIASNRIECELEISKKSFLQMNENFHTYIGSMTGNDKITNLIKNAIHQLQPALFFDVRQSSVTRMMEEHLALVKAIENRDEKKAGNIMQEQLMNSQMRIINLI